MAKMLTVENRLCTHTSPATFGATKQNAPAFDRGAGRSACSLEEIPQELIVDLMVELDFLRFDEGAEGPWTTVGRSLFQVGVASLHVFPEQGRNPLGFAEVGEGVVDVVGQVTLGLAQILDLRGVAVEAGLED